MLLVLALVLVALWNIIVLPSATVHYSKEGVEELRIIWNVQHRIYKGRMPPGSSTSDHGFLFPDERFFMMFDWWSDKGRHHCVMINPTWSTTHIYLDANGDIDRSRTHVDQLKACPGDFEP